MNVEIKFDDIKINLEEVFNKLVDLCKSLVEKIKAMVG